MLTSVAKGGEEKKKLWDVGDYDCSYGKVDISSTAKFLEDIEIASFGDTVI